jgi:hypothetical protein
MPLSSKVIWQPAARIAGILQASRRHLQILGHRRVFAKCWAALEHRSYSRAVNRFDPTNARAVLRGVAPRDLVYASLSVRRESCVSGADQ